MKRKWIIVISVFLFISTIGFLIFNPEKEQPSFKVGVLMTGENRLVKLEGMKNGLENLGYNMSSIEFIIKSANDNRDELDDLAKILLLEDLDVIVTLGGIETQVLDRKMKELQQFIPTVFVGIAAPYELGLIQDYQYPGTYFTGINNFHMNLSVKRLEMLLDLVPEMERVFLIYSGGIDISEMSLQMVVEAANRKNIDIIEVDLNRTGALKQLEAATTERDGILTLPSYQVELLAEDIAAVANEKKVPTMGIYDDDVEAGFLFSYGSTFYDQGYQAARHVSLILQGNKPENLPVELPDVIRFILNEDIHSKLNVEVNEDIRKLAEIYVVGSDLP